MRTWAVASFLILLGGNPLRSASGEAVQARVTEDVTRGLPIVVHVVVALCDNENQGIVPVPKALGNGQNPQTNLYWGALYGVRTHLSRAGGWNELSSHLPADARILDRVVFSTQVERGGQSASVYVVADAWDGAQIEGAIAAFFEMAAGKAADTVVVQRGSGALNLPAGGAAHLLAYVGHNGLMDGLLTAPGSAAPGSPPRSAIVLACASKSYFGELIASLPAHPLLLTTGLMAPEAYTLNAAIRSWAAGESTSAVREAAAESYHRYQQCGLNAARRLFWSAP